MSINISGHKAILRLNNPSSYSDSFCEFFGWESLLTDSKGDVHSFNESIIDRRMLIHDIIEHSWEFTKFCNFPEFTVNGESFALGILFELQSAGLSILDVNGSGLDAIISDLAGLISQHYEALEENTEPMYPTYSKNESCLTVDSLEYYEEIETRLKKINSEYSEYFHLGFEKAICEIFNLGRVFCIESDLNNVYGCINDLSLILDNLEEFYSLCEVDLSTLEYNHFFLDVDLHGALLNVQFTEKGLIAHIETEYGDTLEIHSREGLTIDDLYESGFLQRYEEEEEEEEYITV